MTVDVAIGSIKAGAFLLSVELFSTIDVRAEDVRKRMVKCCCESTRRWIQIHVPNTSIGPALE